MKSESSGLNEDKKEISEAKKKSYPFSRAPTRLPPATKFEGKCDDLKGNIYDCSDSRQSDLFAKTTKEISGYVGRTYKYGGDIRLVVENLEIVDIEMPEDPPTGATRTENRIWEKEVDEHVKRITYLKENIKTLCSLVWGQCTDIMQQRVEATDRFDAMSAAGDGLLLLKTIKDITYQFQSQKYIPHSLYESKK